MTIVNSPTVKVISDIEGEVEENICKVTVTLSGILNQQSSMEEKGYGIIRNEGNQRSSQY